MSLLCSLLLTLPLFIPTVVSGQDPKKPPGEPQVHALFPIGYRSHEALTIALKRAASEHPNLVHLASLGRSLEGRELWIARVGRPDPENGPRRPAIIIVANIEADHVVGSEVAVRLVERLAAADRTDTQVTALFDRVTIQIVPRLNPDGAERMLSAPTRADLRGNARPLDRDRDGQTGEDGPNDMDNDGMALVMRVKDSKATMVPDEKDPRILRAADLPKGESPIYSVYREGSDDDGDGLIDEDPASGVNLNRNWPHKWPEFDAEAGYCPGAEPETRQLIRFLVDHPEAAAVLTYALNDNLASEPKKPASTLDEADLGYFAELARFSIARMAEAAKSAGQPVASGVIDANDHQDRARSAARRSSTPTQPGSASTAIPSLDASADGSLSEWAYQQGGLIALTARLWSSPDIPDPAEGEPKVPAEGEARWLYWNDKVVGGNAFVPFHAVDHPTLGPVEVGGWKPGVRLNPPAERLGPIADAQVDFLKHLASRLARLDLVETKLEPRGDGLFQVSAVVQNQGAIPTALARAQRTRESTPVVVRLRAPGARILAGKPVVKIESLRGSGGREELRWLIHAPEGVRAVEIEAGTPRAGFAKRTLSLQ